MSKFNFRLQRVLDYRASAVEQQQAELGRCQHLLNLAQIELAEIIAEQHSLLAQLEEYEINMLDMNRLNNAWRYLDYLTNKEEAAEAKVQSCEEAVHTARERLIELEKEEQIIEKLKERQSERFQLAAKREETKVLDDLTVTRLRPMKREA